MFKYISRTAFKWSSEVAKRTRFSRQLMVVLKNRKREFCHELAMNNSHYVVDVKINMSANTDKGEREQFMIELLNLCDSYREYVDTDIVATEDVLAIVANNR